MNPCCRRGPGSIGGAPAGWTPSKAADRPWAVISGWDSPRGSVDPGAVGWPSPLMPARLRTLQARLLPHGPLDVVRQVLLFMAAYQLYRLTRGLVNHPEAAA